MKKVLLLLITSIFLFSSCNNSINTLLEDYNNNLNQNKDNNLNNFVPEIGDPDFEEKNMLDHEYFVYNDSTLDLTAPGNGINYEWKFFDSKNDGIPIEVTPYKGSSLTSQKLVLYIPTSQLEEKTYKVTLTVKDKEGNYYTDSCGLVIYNNFTY